MPRLAQPEALWAGLYEYPSEFEIVTTREFDAPIELVFDVLTKPEHMRHWLAPFEEKMTVCSTDLRVAGGLPARSVGPTWRSSRRHGSSKQGCSKAGQTRKPSRQIP
jgi:hypothetical protein